MNKKSFVVAVIPAFNEEKTIAKVILQAKKYVDIVIVCDDGSTDMTAEIAEELGVSVLRHPKNMGKGVALKTALEHLKQLSPDIVVTLDMDGQHDPDGIPRLLEPIIDGKADLIIGSRCVSGSKTDAPLNRKLELKLINSSSRKSGKRVVSDTQSGFRAYSAKALNLMQQSEANGYRLETEQLVKAAKNSLRVLEVPIYYTRRRKTDLGGTNMKVCVVGLGTVGMPTINYIHEHGFQVNGHDLEERAIEGVETFTDWNKVPMANIYVIAASSHSVETICRKIAKRDRNSLILIESTVPVGTCRRISDSYGLHAMVHCPHRYWSEDPVSHGIGQLRVIGALNSPSLQRGLEFYRSFDIPLFVCPTIEIAEMCKIVENAYRFVQIAFAEELRLICEQNGISFDAVREACNTKWNTEILEAREGIFGLCLPKDIGYLRLLASHAPLVDGAILTDRNYQKWKKQGLQLHMRKRTHKVKRSSFGSS